MNILHSIGAGIASIGLFIASIFGFTPTQEAPEELGRAVNPVATNNYTIAGSGISASATTITLTSFTAPVSGAPYTMANFGDGVNAKGYLTIEPGSRTRQEIVSFTAITQNSDGSATLTGVSRGLLPFSPFTASSTYAVPHNGGSQVVVSNPPQLYDAIYSYIDNATTSGAVDGTTLAKGIYETATGIEAASTTAIGGGNTTAGLVLTTTLSTSTGGSAYTVPVTNSSGKIAGSFCCSGTTTLTDGIVGFGSTPSTTIITTLGTSTYAIPSNLRWLEVEVVGAGGGGGGYDTDGTGCCGNSGGAGGYGKSKLTREQLATTSLTFFVGTGGTAGTSASTPQAGSNGGDSRFIYKSGTKIIAGGGVGGTSINSAGGGGGTTTGAQININGGWGSGADISGGASSGGNPQGGINPLGYGSIMYNRDGLKSVPAGWGYGGAGGTDSSSTGDPLAGGNGVIIITEYF